MNDRKPLECWTKGRSFKIQVLEDIRPMKIKNETLLKTEEMRQYKSSSKKGKYIVKKKRSGRHGNQIGKPLEITIDSL